MKPRRLINRMNEADAKENESGHKKSHGGCVVRVRRAYGKILGGLDALPSIVKRKRSAERNSAGQNTADWISAKERIVLLAPFLKLHRAAQESPRCTDKNFVVRSPFR